MNNLFLTGEKGIGKSTLIKEVLGKINMTIGGYMTERVVVNGIKTFTACSLYDDTIKFDIANINMINGGKDININVFKSDLPLILDESLKYCEVIVLDELGFIEDKIDEFKDMVYRLLESERIVFGVIKDYDCDFLNTIRGRKDVKIITITEDNRDYVIGEIIDALISFKL